MSWQAWLTFCLVAGVVWGGFLLAITLALRRERDKRRRSGR